MNRAKSVVAAVTVAAGLVFGLGATPASAYAEGHNVTIKNGASGQCLEVADWRTDNGAPVRQWGCTGGADQRWDIVPTWSYSNVSVIRNVYSGKCLEIADWRTDYSAQARQWNCSGGANQHWGTVTERDSTDRPCRSGMRSAVSAWR
ncbi:RICIN domain-containing protein [Streptomyces sp. NPDC060048]